MENKYWEDKWEAGDIRFHQSQFNAHLLKNFSGREDTSVFVPLCGKTLDMQWLAEEGHKVVGVELSPIACEAFFREAQSPFREKTDSGFTVYEGESITLWCGDFFKLPKKALNGVTFVYDRAALIALPPDMRQRYTTYLKSLLSTSHTKKIQTLLITIEYSQELAEGPPFSVGESEVETLYGDMFRKASQYLQPVDPERRIPKLQNLPELSEHVYLLETKLS